MSTRYKDKPFFLRIKEITSIRNKYPDKIPVIVERAQAVTNIPELSKNKYLAPASLTFGQFIYMIRKQLVLAPEKALFMFVDGTLVHASMLIGELYNKYKSLDGFLYMEYTGESTFGTGGVVHSVGSCC
jgi:GABA(A) receptor-associated protein